MSNIKYSGGYKVETLTDTDTSNRPVFNDNIHYEYRYATEALNTKDPLGLNSGTIKIPSFGIGGNGLVVGAIVLFIILIMRR